MSTAYSPLPELFPSSLMSSSPGNGGAPGDDSAQIFDRLRSLLSDYLDAPDNLDSWQQMLEQRRVAAAAILKFPRKEMQSMQVDDARQLIRDFSGSGVHDRPVSAEDLALVQSAAKKGWQGLLAGMLLTPAWQWADAPLLLSVPDWLRADYVSWLFAAPQGFSEVGQAEAYAAFTLRRLEELVRWVDRCPGATAEAEVLSIFVAQSSAIPLYLSSGSLRRHAELRGRLLLRALRQPDDYYDAPIASRAGRRLRVGFLNQSFGSNTETFSTLPYFERLDPERFEIILFAICADGGDVENYCRQLPGDFFLLPEDIDSQLAMLRAAGLDVLVFGSNVTALPSKVTQLALHRIAALQVVTHSSFVTSGLPESDLFISGNVSSALESAGDFSERVGVLPGPAHAFSYDADGQKSKVSSSRADFGLPDSGSLFISAANYLKITPEVQHAWARLLAAVPSSHLLIHPCSPKWAGFSVKRFRASFDEILAGHGVETSRLAVSNSILGSREDVKSLLSIGDVYLDAFPLSGTNSLVDPLELGLPVVVREGQTFRSRIGSALLRQLELPEMITMNDADYHTLAVGLATNPANCQKYRTRIEEAMSRSPLFLDRLATSEAFGDLIETAFDELCAQGRQAFRASRVVLAAASNSSRDIVEAKFQTDPIMHAHDLLKHEPANPKARQAIGRELLRLGRSARAVIYLLAALQGEEKNSDLWLDVAQALRADGQLPEALQALEAGLKIDPTMLEGWMMFAEVAAQLGSADIAREAAGVAHQLAPGDARTTRFL